MLYLVTEDWYFCSHRLHLAEAAAAAGYEVHVATRVVAHGQRMREAGIEVHPLDFNRGDRRVWRELPVLARIAALYRRLAPALVHQVAMKPVLYGSLAAYAAPSVRVVNALAGLGYLFTTEQARRSLAAKLVRQAMGPLLGRRGRAVIVQNSDDRAMLEALGIRPTCIHLIRGAGVDVSHFRPSAEPAGVPVVAMVARLLKDKGVRELATAARLLRERGVKARIVLAGGTDPANPASIGEGEVRGWVDQGLVEWWGHVDDVRELWRQAHIAVLPSYREGLPKALLEAAASGRPLVATDVTGCREIAVAGQSALMVPAQDAHALADALATLIADAGLRTRLGAGARRLVEAEFSEARVVNETLALYARTLGE